MDFGSSGECASAVVSHGTCMITINERSYLVEVRERLFVMSLHASRLLALRKARDVESCAVSIAAILGLTPDKVIPLPVEQTVRTPPAVPLFDVQVMVGPDLATKYATQSLTPAAGTPAGAAASTTTKAA